MNLTIDGVAYSFVTAMTAIQHETRLIGERYGSDIDASTVPVFVKFRARQIIEKGWGVAQ